VSLLKRELSLPQSLAYSQHGNKHFSVRMGIARTLPKKRNIPKLGFGMFQFAVGIRRIAAELYAPFPDGPGQPQGDNLNPGVFHGVAVGVGVGEGTAVGVGVGVGVGVDVGDSTVKAAEACGPPLA
jgi:hypothetical protein